MADVVSIVRWPLVLLLAGCAAQPSDPTPSSLPSVSRRRSRGDRDRRSRERIAIGDTRASSNFELTTFPVPAGSHPHDVAPAADGGVWYTAQATGQLGWLDPERGEVREIPLGPGRHRTA